MPQTLEKKPLDAFHLKCIALFCMVLDHVAAAAGKSLPMARFLGPMDDWFRCIGRIAFPIFAFFIAEGCRYTHDRKKYLLRLGIFALISEIPFDLAFFSARGNDGLLRSEVNFLNETNVFFTFFFAVALIHIYEALRRQTRKRQLLAAAAAPVVFAAGLGLGILLNGYVCIVFLLVYLAGLFLMCERWTTEGGDQAPGPWTASVLALLPLLPVLFAVELLDCDYSVFGVVVVVVLYLLKDRKWQLAALAVGLIWEYGQSLRYIQDISRFRVTNILLRIGFALIAVVLLALYNGKRGKNVKWAFYAAYPVHIAILAIIQRVLGNE